ncbi:MAG: YkgJ family cysteine cluster protein [Bdellovibrionaceae bacterium]|nr:YkgJ family cysteine cluster protein [Pseudobdellovibrionaceae bacterium]
MDFRQYEEFLAKVDAKFAEIHARHAEKMKCAAGCHGCCVPNLTVFRIEKENIARHIRSVPGLDKRLSDLHTQNPHQGSRCRFLDASGQCAIYEVRPLVCRSHGVPLFAKGDAGSILDVCPLNFSEVANLAELPGTDFINLELVNSILATINRTWDPQGERFALDIHGVLESGD